VVSVYKNGNTSEALPSPGLLQISAADDNPGVQHHGDDLASAGRLAAVPPGATFKVFHNPLINWLWFGGIIFILGTMIAAWPDREGEAVPAAIRRPGYGTVKA
jgi:hypothetical protein